MDFLIISNRDIEINQQIYRMGKAIMVIVLQGESVTRVFIEEGQKLLSKVRKVLNLIKIVPWL